MEGVGAHPSTAQCERSQYRARSFDGRDIRFRAVVVGHPSERESASATWTLSPGELIEYERLVRCQPDT